MAQRSMHVHVRVCVCGEVGRLQHVGKADGNDPVLRGSGEGGGGQS